MSKIAAAIYVALFVLTIVVDGNNNTINSTQKECLAKEILMKVQKGESVDYDHIVIKGDFDLSELILKKNITSAIRIKNSTFDGRVILDSIILNEPIILSGSYFNKEFKFRNVTFIEQANFVDTTFHRSANFEKTKFNNDAIFWNCSFQEDADFLESTFYQGAWFVDSTFAKGADFRRAKFGCDAEFVNTTFDKLAQFRGSYFNCSSYFFNSDFRDVADFSDSSFKGDIHFFLNKFNKTATFQGSEFGSVAEFSLSIFEDVVDFGSTRFEGFAGFGDVVFKKSVTFSNSDKSWSKISIGTLMKTYNYSTNLTSYHGSSFNGTADFSRSIFYDNADYRCSRFNSTVDFKDSLFKEKIDVTNSAFNGILLGWDDLENAFISNNEVTYIKMINNFKDHGQFDEANRCYYKYRLQYMASPLDFFSYISCGFGVYWPQTIFFGLFSLLLFGLAYFVQMDLVQIRELEEHSLLKTISDSLWFSSVVLLSIPRELYPNKEDIYKIYAKNISFHLPILERLIGWGILILFINTLSRVMLHL